MTSSSDGGPDENPSIILPARKQGVVARLRNYFLTGVVVAAPIGLTIYITDWFVEKVDTWFVPLIPEAYRPENFLSFNIYGIGLLVALVLLTLLGALTANIFGRAVLDLAERLVERMPIVRTIYGALKQIFETVISSSTPSFREVGLIEYPRKGCYAVVFVVSQGGSVVGEPIGKDLAAVFLPTSPNTITGLLLYVPREDLIILDMTIEEGAKLVVSAGLVEPPSRKPGPI
ncbi:MAG: DUF502 domain-containing protein [Parvibaculum sp.]|uniref:DUF502 domain-containing protein n=1 Tax=Parvibaculum sp. TaxID=2024848 RepID=UPI0025FF7647|nr:DUF502 domain-containing protein [Parvibaculum sp.]MCE9649269.1 DUF502 domain-containing protein [Parvibaculum sp.]